MLQRITKLRLVYQLWQQRKAKQSDVNPEKDGNAKQERRLARVTYISFLVTVNGYTL